MKRILLTAFAAFISFSMADAQLVVDSEGKASITTESTSLKPRLSVGWDTYFEGYYSTVGIAGTPKLKPNLLNIGVQGTLISDPDIPYTKNIGVLGLVNIDHDSNSTVNYGVSGMIGGNGGSNNGGAGIFGSNTLYKYYYAESISGFYAGYFYGPVKMTGDLTVPNVYTTSDSRLKENIVPLNEMDNSGMQTLENILNMNVVEYNYKDTEAEDLEKASNDDIPENVKSSIEIAKKNNAEMASKRHIGLIAQELKEIYPDMVQEGQDGYLAVNYSELVPVLIRSIQVLKQEVDELKGVDGSARMAPQSLGMNSTNATSKNKLFQNTPNPFKEKTIIRFQLAEDVRDAAICIFDMSGKMLKQVNVDSSMQSITIGGNELLAGMYIYSLVVNGNEIDTKRMILSK